MSLEFQELSIQFENDIRAGKIKTLNDIKEFVIANIGTLSKPSEPRRLFRNGCKLLKIDLNTAKAFIQSDNDLKLALGISSIVPSETLDDFLKTV